MRVPGHPAAAGAAEPLGNQARAADAARRSQVGSVAAESDEGLEGSVGEREGGRGGRWPA